MFKVVLFDAGPDKGEPGARQDVLMAATARRVMKAFQNAARQAPTVPEGVEPIGVDVYENDVLILTAYQRTVAEVIAEAIAMHKKAVVRQVAEGAD